MSRWENRCGICLENFTNDKYTTCCKHDFHESCLNIWSEKYNSCPTCRGQLDRSKPVAKYSYQDLDGDMEYAQTLIADNDIMQLIYNSLRQEELREMFNHWICVECESNPCICAEIE